MHMRSLLAALACVPGIVMAGDLRGYTVSTLEEAQAKSRSDGRPVLLYLTDSKS